MSEVHFWIDGTPATFATAKEFAWKRALARQIPSPTLQGQETGLLLRFVLPSLAPWGHPLDVDNLCEPLFSVLVNRLGWFNGRRPNIRWWRATKEGGEALGCAITVSTEPVPPALASSPEWEELYTGPLPSSARSPEVAEWAHRVRHEHAPDWIPRSCALSLGFSRAAINLGDIATGPVKSFIDCLYPLLGGHAGAPQDHRIDSLTVTKDLAHLPEDTVFVRLWTDHKIRDKFQAAPSERPASAPPRKEPVLSRRAEEEITNPCRPGTFKWIVCEGALQEKPVAEVRHELEQHKRGAGARLREYISDLRSENKLDIRIEGDRLHCYGQR